MRNKVIVLGTVGADMKRVIDTDHDTSTLTWLTLVGLDTGNALRLEGRGNSVKIMLDSIVDGVQRAEADFVRDNGGAIVIAGLT